MAVLGTFQAFPRKVVRAIKEMLKIAKKHERLKVNIALNYGGQDEIIRAIRQIKKEKIPPAKINEKILGKYLYTSGEPDPDLLIRTAQKIWLKEMFNLGQSQ